MMRKKVCVNIGGQSIIFDTLSLITKWESNMLDDIEVKVLSSFIGGYTMTNYYLCKAMYQMMAYDLCLKGEQNV